MAEPSLEASIIRVSIAQGLAEAAASWLSTTSQSVVSRDLGEF